MIKKFCTAWLAGLCLWAQADSPRYRPVAIASFNVAWAGTAADYAQHVAVCSAPSVNWCDSRIRRPGAANDIAAAQRCQQATQSAAGGLAAAMQVAPCNAYQASGAQATRANYQAKLKGLRATVAQLIEVDKVRLIAFQELRSNAALKEILGPHAADFETCVAPHNAFQSLGFAWHKSLSDKPGVCSAYQPLAIAQSDAARRLRPGLALALSVSGEPVTFMNLHLKSACANLVTTRKYEGHLLTDPDSACETLNRQVAPLESWLESVAQQSPRLVLMGDFNRRIDEEAAAAIPKDQVRTTGIDPAQANPPDARGRVSSRYLWQELSDGSPRLHQMPLLKPSLVGNSPAACTGFIGLDHIVISDALQVRQGLVMPSARKVAVVSQPGQVIQTSDHCPTVGVLKL
jgi:endonuclease/exonuclease/phosphatase family metal-dependent hydrolase